MILSALERLVALLVLQPGTGVEETLLLAAAVLLVVAVAGVLTAATPSDAAAARTASAFADVRVLLGTSHPAARGHRRARAPGSAS